MEHKSYKYNNCKIQKLQNTKDTKYKSCKTQRLQIQKLQNTKVTEQKSYKILKLKNTKVIIIVYIQKFQYPSGGSEC